MTENEQLREPEVKAQSDIPVVPLPPGGGFPIPNPDQTPVVPLPPAGGIPSPNPDQTPVIPLPPIVGNPEPSAGFCTVRFLNAVRGSNPFNVNAGGRRVARNLAYGNISNYFRITDGFYTVTISNARNAGMVYYRSRVPFNAGEIITMAIIQTPGGIDLVRISDQPCRNRPRNRGCLRAVNLVRNSPPLDVIFTDGRIVFPNVSYREITSFKQIRPGEYEYYVAQTPYIPAAQTTDINLLENIPIVIRSFILPGFGRVEPLVSSFVTVEAGGMYTIYMLGSWNVNREVMVKTY